MAYTFLLISELHRGSEGEGAGNGIDVCGFDARGDTVDVDVRGIRARITREGEDIVD